MQATQTAIPRGRPRDPEVERRVFDAAAELYGATGWDGFSFDAIARAAGVGKSALYRRWPDRGALLRAMLDARWRAAGAIDTGSVRDDLVALGAMIVELLAGSRGSIALHLQADAHRSPDIRRAVRPFRDKVTANCRAIVERGIARGELRADAQAMVLLNLLAGSLKNRTLALPAGRPDPARGQFVVDVVDMILHGAAAR